ncbi:hypothetical protein ACIQAC_28595 [Streptomyces sp. NPDC088387]|uniref:hypothetical protein n=1 Tax=Streptomyces sp. NPDC088387 TaxID=3365859 RepID=UPI003800083B
MTAGSALITTVEATVTGSLKPTTAVAGLEAKTEPDMVARGKTSPASLTATARVKSG